MNNFTNLKKILISSLLVLSASTGIVHSQVTESDNASSLKKATAMSYNLPDNFFESKCNYKADKFNFSIALRYESTVNVDNYCAMAAGDIDGDGNAEIVAMMPNNNSHHTNGTYLTNGFHIFNHDATVRKSVLFPNTNPSNTSFIFSTSANSVTLADLDNDGKGEIIFSTVGYAGGTDFKLYVYDYNGDLKSTISSKTPFVNTTGIADFNNDGYPEIYSGTNIYTYRNGTLALLHEGNATMYAVAQDVNGDKIPEIVTPAAVYQVSLTNLTGYAGNTITQTKNCPSAISGVHALADVDLDGVIEVVSVVQGQDNMQLVIWNTQTGAVKYTQTVVTGCIGLAASSFPFIGDTDNNGYPDIAFMGGVNAQAGCTSVFRYQYDKTSNTVKFISKDNSFQDYSSRVTGLSMFDFNIDGRMEVVYRDEINLYILKGTDFSKEVIVPGNGSGTLREYPLIVSLTPSGESFILINSGLAINQIGTLRIYGADTKSGGTPWAPARKMWNQFAFYQNTMYDNLQVIPNPASLNLELTSTDGKNTKMRPFNGHMFQLGPIEKNTLEYVHPSPDMGVVSLDYNYNIQTNKLDMKLVFNNTGEVQVDPIIPVNIYKYSGGVGTKIMTYGINDIIKVGDVKTYNFSIDNFGVYIPHDSIVVKAGEGLADCNPNNNVFKIDTHYDKLCDDFYGMFNKGTGAVGTFSILANDKLNYGITTLGAYSSSAGSTLSRITGNPDQLGYQSPANFIGIDTIYYSSTGVNTNGNQQLVYAKAYIYVYPGKTVDCQITNKSIRINDIPNKVTVDYFDAATGGSNANTQSASSTVTKNIYAEVVFNVSGVLQPAFNNRIQTPYVLEISPALLYWSKNAANSNWNDPGNWVNASGQQQNAVPRSCTDVHIPGNANFYPSLDIMSTPRTVFYGEPVCNNITYHFGGEVAKPYYLTYNKAYIQYNFGYYNGTTYQTDGDAYSAIPMERDRWYALAAPLKSMYTGDFSLGGFPNTWQQGFQTSPGHNSDLVGDWYTPENYNKFSLGASQNYAVSLWIGHYSSELGESNHKNLNALKGIFEIPYFENSTINNYHPTHEYNAGTKTSRFHYYYYNTPSMTVDPNLYDEVTRSTEAYRFVFEDSNNKPQTELKVTVPANEMIMIGNPFLSSLDFKSFYYRNINALTTSVFYKLYEKGQFTTYNTSSLIAPLQAFFIQTKGVTGSTVDLYFSQEASVARTGALQLKASSSSSQENVLQAEAVSKSGSSRMVLLFTNEQENNIPRMFSNDYKGAVPQIYTVDNQGIKNDVQYESGYESAVKLGIKCSSTEDIELRFNTSQFATASLVLVDNYLNKRQDLFQNSVYRFKNNPDNNSDRFTLEVGKNMAPTGLDDLKASSIRVYTIGKQLNIDANEEIADVQVTTVHGVKIISEQSTSSRHFSKEINALNGVYIVKVKLVSGETKTEKVILK